jgi:kilA-N, DNA-binding domain protein
MTKKDMTPKNNITNRGSQSIERVIYTFRGVQVMLDRDSAKMYNVETKVLNQAVKRNSGRFPERFMFQLSKEEFDNWKSQIVTSNMMSQSEIESFKMAVRRAPYAFTEQGVAQLSAVLKSDTAIEVSIRIMDAFVAMRRFISTNAEMFQRIERLESHQTSTDEKVEHIMKRMDELAPAITPEQIFATGCVWDAWDYVSQLVRSAKQRIVLIDNFVDERVLTLLTKRAAGVSATIHSRYTQQFKLDLEKHNEQYEPIEFIQIPHKSHDRFLFIDDNVYLLGTSIKDMGTSLCAITRLETTADIVMQLF